MPPAIVVKDLCKRYNGKQVLHRFSLTLNRGEITAILGPNGAGKSTIFNLISGALKPDSGSIDEIDRYRFSYVFQNYRDSLLPWRSNGDNLAFPLEIQGKSLPERVKKVRRVVRQVGVELKLDSYPYELSGGQQQMLVFLRALITDPKVMLLDEPFSALDYENTLRMRDVLQSYYQRTKATIVIVTHDVEEAVALGGRILVLSSNPTRVAGDIGNRIPYPRTVETMKQESFHQIKNKSLELFQKVI